jgi:bifunctional DNase/RNase
MSHRKRIVITLLGFWWVALGGASAWVASAQGVPKDQMREAEILGVALEGTSKQPYVLLREKDGKGVVEIFIGTSEAQSIALALNEQATPRPLTHDLMISILRELQVQVKGISIIDLRENTYYALLDLQSETKELSLDCRPSDAIALALRAGAPILVHTKLLKEPPSKPDRLDKKSASWSQRSSRRFPEKMMSLGRAFAPPRSENCLDFWKEMWHTLSAEHGEQEIIRIRRAA